MRNNLDTGRSRARNDLQSSRDYVNLIRILSAIIGGITSDDRSLYQSRFLTLYLFNIAVCL